MNRPWTMPLPETAEGTELAPHEMPIHTEMALGDLPQTHGAHSQWRQQGTRIDCITCPNPHGLFIAPRQIYTGTVNREGAPIIKNRW